LTSIPFLRNDKRPPRLPSYSGWIAPALAAGAMILAWLILRNPWLRLEFLALTPHRPPHTEWGTARQWMAPRCCLAAGLLGTFASLLLFFRNRGLRVSPSGRLPVPLAIQIMVWVQALTGFAVAANLIVAQKWFQGAWPLLAGPDRVLARVVGPMIDEALALRESLPPGTNVVLFAPLPPLAPDNRFLFHSLAYPVGVYKAPEYWMSPVEQRALWRLLLSSRNAQTLILRTPELGIWFEESPQAELRPENHPAGNTAEIRR
jgi:hypothetical protein